MDSTYNEAEDEDYIPNPTNADKDNESDSCDEDEDMAEEYDEFEDQGESQMGNDEMELYNENVIPRNKPIGTFNPVKKASKWPKKKARRNFGNTSLFGNQNIPVTNPEQQMPVFVAK